MMKKFILSLVLFAQTAWCGLMAQEVESQTTKQPISQTTSHDWEDETVFAINKEDGRATMLLYANEAEMKADEASRKPWLPVHSSLRMMLSGTWQFHWSPTEGFLRTRL